MSNQQTKRRMVMRVTVKEFAAKQNLPPASANTVLTWLKSKGIVQLAGQMPKEPNTKGKAANIFEVPEGNVTITM